MASKLVLLWLDSVRGLVDAPLVFGRCPSCLSIYLCMHVRTLPAYFLYLAMSRYTGFGRSIFVFWSESSSAPSPFDGGVGRRGIGTVGSAMSIRCIVWPICNWGMGINLGTNTSQKYEAVPRRLVFKAHRLLYHANLGSRVMTKKK